MSRSLTEYLPGHEERESKGCLFLADAETLNYSFFAWSVDCRPDVYRKGQLADEEGDQEFFGPGPIHGVLGKTLAHAVME